MAIDSTRPVIKVLAPGPQGRVGDTGDKGDKGDKGDQGDQGNPSVIRGTLSAGAWVEPATPQAGDLWIAGGSITGDVTAALGEGLSYDGDIWTNVGQVRGPVGAQGIQGYSITIKGTLSAGAWSAPASPTVGDIWIAGGSITGAITAVLGDGIEYTVSGWLNVGQVRGPIGPSSSNTGTVGSIPQFSTTTAVVDSKIKEIATNVYEQSNGTSAQKFRINGTKTDASNYRGVEISDTTAGAAKIDSTGLGTGVSGNTLELAAGGVTGLRFNSSGGAEGPLGTLMRTHSGDLSCILPGATSGSRVEATLSRHTLGTGDITITKRVEVPTSNPSATLFLGALWEDSNNRIYWYVNSSGALTLTATKAGSATSVTVDSSFVTKFAGQVVLLAIERVGTTITVYWNAQNVYSATVTGSDISFTTAALLICGNSSNSAVSWGYRIYNCRLFRRALSAADVVTLMNKGVDSSDEWDSPTSLTSGTLIIGKRYRIKTFVAGDSFTNVGAASNATGVEFVATGTTPTTWTNASTLDRIGCIIDWDLSTGVGLSIPDRSSNCYVGQGTGITHPRPTRYGSITYCKQLLHSEISSTAGTTKLFDLPPNCGVTAIELVRTAAMDSGITLDVGISGNQTKYSSAIVASTTGIVYTASSSLASESATADTAVYVKKSGSTTVGDITARVTMSIRG